MSFTFRGLRASAVSARAAPWRTLAVRVGVVSAAFFCGVLVARGGRDGRRDGGARAAATATGAAGGRTAGASEAGTAAAAAAAAAVAPRRGGGGGGGGGGAKGGATKGRKPPPKTYLGLPPTTAALLINIGPHTSSLVPPAGAANTSVLAVEAHPEVAAALLAKEVPRYPGRFFVLPAAVVGPSSPGGVPGGGVRSFHTYGLHGRSSSLAEHAHPEASFGRDGPGATEGAVAFVAELTLRQLLDAIPPRVTLPLLKIDAQGMDWDIVVGGGGAVKRVDRLQAEVDMRVGHSDYVGVRNNLEKDWRPLMAKLGFEVEHINSPEATETQVIFRRKGVAPKMYPARA